MYPVCSFCGDQAVVVWFEGPDFRNAVQSADQVRSGEAYLACAVCLALIEANDRERLAARELVRQQQRGGLEPGVTEQDVVEMGRHLTDIFWAARAGETVMTDELDLLEELPPFPAYVLPPGEFPGFSAVSYGGSMLGTKGIAMVEYLYRPDYDLQGRMVAVSSTRPTDGNELHRESSMWWASGTVRSDEILTGEFPMNAGVVAGVGARYMGEAMAEVEGHPCQLQRWTTIPEHAIEDALSVVRVRTPESWVTLDSNSYTVEELERLVPRLRRVDPDLVKELKLAIWDWMKKFEEGA
jgi:hypothetical protein